MSPRKPSSRPTDARTGDIVELFDRVSAIRPDGAVLAFDLLCVRQGLPAERLAGLTSRAPAAVLRDLAWLERLLERDRELRKLFARVEAASGAAADGAGSRDGARGGRSSRRAFLGSHPARTDASGRLRVPPAFAALNPSRGWLAVVDSRSGVLLPRPPGEAVATGVPSRLRGRAPLRSSVDLGPAWADAEVLVLGDVDHLVVCRATELSRSPAGRAAAGPGESPAASSSDPIPTGLAGLDDALHGGLWRGEVATVGAMPGTGLSTLALQVALGVARRKERVAFVGSHLDPQAVRLRLECLSSGVGLLVLLGVRGVTESHRDRLARVRGPLDRAPLLVACGVRSARDVELCLRAAAARGATLAVVDNVLFPAGHSRRGFDRLRKVAAECRLAVLVMTRLSRRASPWKPKIEDVRAFEAASAGRSAVVLLHRPALWTTNPPDDDDEVVLLGNHGSGRLLWKRHDGPRYLDVRRGRRQPAGSA